MESSGRNQWQPVANGRTPVQAPNANSCRLTFRLGMAAPWLWLLGC